MLRPPGRLVFKIKRKQYLGPVAELTFGKGNEFKKIKKNKKKKGKQDWWNYKLNSIILII